MRSYATLEKRILELYSVNLHHRNCNAELMSISMRMHSFIMKLLSLFVNVISLLAELVVLIAK